MARLLRSVISARQWKGHHQYFKRQIFNRNISLERKLFLILYLLSKGHNVLSLCYQFNAVVSFAPRHAWTLQVSFAADRLGISILAALAFLVRSMSTSSPGPEYLALSISCNLQLR